MKNKKKKTLDLHLSKRPKIIYEKSNEFAGRDLFPEQTARANAMLANLKWPPGIHPAKP